MNKTLAAIVLGMGVLGAGCRLDETGRIYSYYAPIETAAEAAGWNYVNWDCGSYGKNPEPCEQLSSFPGKETLLLPINGVKENNVVSGNMCCLGDIEDSNFWVDYCILLE
ncbi:MAG: hypothetical protein KJ955_02645 [Nanoarchaeota archaeon]|nr:hypothetical protein [Nanoarchaeota archaeon]